jgi:DNA-binding CsgD family transcriptional regulator
MEGGVIMDNTAIVEGGGFCTGSRGSFKKTGGIIYGSDAPAGLRNTAINGVDDGRRWPILYGHAVCVAAIEPPFLLRDDTVTENDNLTYTGAPRGPGVYDKSEKWDTSVKAFRRMLLIVLVPAFVFVAAVFFIVMKIVLKKRLAKITQIAESAPDIDMEGLNLTNREKEVCKLLLTELTFKEIASALKLSNSGVYFHAQNLYRKLGIQSRTELFVKLVK